MSKLDQWLLYVANALVGGTGLVYAWMRYLQTPEGEFAIVNHPWQSDVQHLHILAAPLLVLVIGHIAYHHAIVYWQAGTKPGRRTGITMLVLALPMIFSGYLLQTSVSEIWRNTWIVIHVATSLLWIAGFLCHLISHTLPRRRDVLRHGA